MGVCGSILIQGRIIIISKHAAAAVVAAAVVVVAGIVGAADAVAPVSGTVFAA